MLQDAIESMPRNPMLKYATLVGMLCAASILSASDDFPLKRLPLFTYVVDYEAAWSPDGRQIVLISSRHGGMKVHIMETGSESHGSDMRQITGGADEDDSPAWSADGSKIAFVSIRGGVSHIFVMNADGTDIRQLTNGPGENIHPMWSADSSRILFNTTHFAEVNAPAARSRGENRVIGETTDDFMDLATIRSDGTDLQRLTRGGGYTYASFSPDGRFILHRRQKGEVSQVFLMKSDGSEDHNLSGGSTLDGWPDWSPDGKRIVFSRHTPNGFQLFVTNRDGTAVRQLTDAAGEFVNPRWSPDGSKILCGRRLGGINLVVFQAPSK
jgi:Tol biopolymer transport system component